MNNNKDNPVLLVLILAIIVFWLQKEKKNWNEQRRNGSKWCFRKITGYRL